MLRGIERQNLVPILAVDLRTSAIPGAGMCSRTSRTAVGHYHPIRRSWTLDIQITGKEQFDFPCFSYRPGFIVCLRVNLPAGDGSAACSESFRKFALALPCAGG